MVVAIVCVGYALGEGESKMRQSEGRERKIERVPRVGGRERHKARGEKWGVEPTSHKIH